MQNKSPQTVVASIDEIAKLCSRPITIEFHVGGNLCRIISRHLYPRETDILDSRLKERFAPIKKGKSPDGSDDTIDFLDPEYRRWNERINREIRDVAIFWTCDEIQKNKIPSILDIYSKGWNEIVDYMEHLFTDDVLNLIYKEIVASDLSVAEQTNFTLPAGFQKSQS